MEEHTNYTVPLTTGGGYTCQWCNEWVPGNTIHGCGTRPLGAPDYSVLLGRIATALERIAALLEARHGR